MLRDAGVAVAEELSRRALRLEQIKQKAAIAHRRGFTLPQELLDLLEEGEIS